MSTPSGSYDIVVVGATPAGIMAAIAGARHGSTVALCEYHDHVGGMSTSGLGKSDIENKEAIAGLFAEFTRRVLEYYEGKYGKDSENVVLCKEGYYYEPSVAEGIFNEMLGEEENISVLLHHQIEDVVMESDAIAGVVFHDRAEGIRKTVRGHVCIDATYEGDLLALAGAAYRLGRESREQFDERHAGRIFFDYNEMEFLEGSTGEEDHRLPAYTYRLCLTDDPENSCVLTTPPEGYDREYYVQYFDDLKAGRLGAPKVFKEGHGYYPEHFDTMVRVFSFARLPNRKYDVNINPRPLGFPFPEENYTYPESTWKEREQIFQRHRALTLGLLYFVQNDPEIPEDQRALARKYHLPLDEFTDNEHFAWQLYVREARRLKGRYTLTENDVRLHGKAGRTTIFEDSIISGEFPIDSFPVSKEPSPDNKVLEGYIGMLEISPYQVPFRIMVPDKIRRLIVPVAASTTHVAFSTIRMEPLWMGIGQAAGTAAHLAVRKQVEIENVPVPVLQKLLIENRQILSYFCDLNADDKAFQAVQFWGTKGFFDSYEAKTMDPVDPVDLAQWLKIFGKLSGINMDFSEIEKYGDNSLSGFAQIIFDLGKENNIWNPKLSQIEWLTHPDIGPDQWKYSRRDHSLPVLRGEACLALYYLFFYLS